jgi:2'-5' RNA ligase
MAELELRTALTVAVPEAAATVDGWRERTSYAKPSCGVPTHITILFPFVPPAEVGAPLIEELRDLFGTFESFRFELRAPGRFPGVLYLAPEPPEPFQQLTNAVWRAYPQQPPYEGAFDTIVPHLTTAEGDTTVLDEAERDVRKALPIAAQATEVLLLEEVEPDSARWEQRARFRLGRGAREAE